MKIVRKVLCSLVCAGMLLSTLSVTAGAEEMSLDDRIANVDFEEDPSEASLIIIDLHSEGRHEDVVNYGPQFIDTLGQTGNSPHGSVIPRIMGSMNSLGQTSEAIEYGKSMIDNYPYHWTASRVMDYKISLGQAEEGIDYAISKFESGGPFSAGALVRRIGGALMSEGRYQEAADLYLNNIELQSSLTPQHTRVALSALGRENEIPEVMNEMFFVEWNSHLAVDMASIFDEFSIDVVDVYLENDANLLLEHLADGVKVSDSDFQRVVGSVELTEDTVALVISAGPNIDNPEPAYQGVIDKKITDIVDQYPGVDEFNNQMSIFVDPLLRRCSDSYRLQTYEGLLSKLPLKGTFSEWEDTLKSYSWRVDQLKD